MKLKKILKIIGLYILFGIIIALIVSTFGGAYQKLLVGQSMGSMDFSDFLFLNGYVALLWLPMIVMMFFSKINFFSSIYIKIASIVIVIVFLLLCIRIIRKH
ncbi:MAG: hypothetical protein ACI4WM_01220 [Erysipelotrichaceae bacterium]